MTDAELAVMQRWDSLLTIVGVSAALVVFLLAVIAVQSIRSNR